MAVALSGVGAGDGTRGVSSVQLEAAASNASAARTSAGRTFLRILAITAPLLGVG